MPSYTVLFKKNERKVNMSSEIRIGLIGGVDSGKSSTISVLINRELDDGNGKARSKIAQFKHERESGRTSSITINYMPTENGGTCYSLVDLAGHEKYLKTTVKGLSGYQIEYVIIVVGANMGFGAMSIEHLKLAILFRIPYIIVITKVDLSPDNILKETIEKVRDNVKKLTGNRNQSMLSIIKEAKDYPSVEDMSRICPLFLISNKTGNGIDLLRNFIIGLPARLQWNQSVMENPVFITNNVFLVNGIGLVLSGKMTRGVIKKGDRLMTGSMNGRWKEMVVRSLHDSFQTTVESLKAGEAGCLAIKFKEDIKKDQLKRGMIVTSKGGIHQSREFRAEIMILTTHSTTMSVGYQPMINCGIANQSARILAMDKEVLRGGERSIVKFEFIHKPEYIEVGQYFILREGKTKGFGKIIETWNCFKASQ